MNLHAVDLIFKKYMAENYFNGGTCYVTVNGEKVFHKAYGSLSQDQKENVTPDTIFDLASVTKIVTTTIILRMISENVLSLHTPLGDCLQKASQNKHLSSITVQQLLTHSSGLRAWHAFYAEQNGLTLFDVMDQIDLLKSTSEPVEYSDLNFMLLGEVAKQHYGRSLQEIIKVKLIDPLELRTLTYNPLQKDHIAATEFGNRIEKRMCQERGLNFKHWRSEHVPIIGEANDGNTYYFFEGESGHAGLFSNVEDIVSVAELYLKGGIYKDREIISKPLIDEAMTLQVAHRGLGWEASDIYPSGIGHTGFTGTALWIEPKYNLAVGILTNRLNVGAPKNINPFRREVFKEILKQI